MFLLDVTDVKRLTTVRQEFVANLTHELKTPLTSLRLAVESLALNVDDGERKRFSERALRETDHLAAILDNLRQLAEIESGNVALQRTRFGLRTLVQQTVERMLYDRPVNLDVAAELTVVADETRTAQMLTNLLDNAAKFSPAGSAVDVSAVQTSDDVVVQVRDRGPGLSPEHWDRVFERFYKVDPARSREAGGSGLGLSITRHLVLAQGGRIWTEAAHDGGQVFAFSLPVNKP